MTSRVRRMRIEDIDQVYAIETTAHPVPWTREILRDCVIVEYDCYVLEKVEDLSTSLIGYIICRTEEQSSHILNICIAPEFQGKHYGRYLLQNTLDFLIQQGILNVCLEVRPSNIVAMHLYEKLGFQQVGIKPDYYQDHFGFEDAVLLEKKLICQ